jgi:excisionase family DNA binding protein
MGLAASADPLWAVWKLRHLGYERLQPLRETSAMSNDRRDPHRPDRRRLLSGARLTCGRRSSDAATGQGWTVGQLAYLIQVSDDFILGEIRTGAILASKFGREYRIAPSAVRDYLLAKRYPLPESLAS